ncbi:MAG TPA: VPLPA-CTERM sorting domain-containing protein [Pseudolabrys sp.]|nr:VPLPA-CTERM sorting domain-containing protein [Pseudolabrys sp.]
MSLLPKFLKAVSAKLSFTPWSNEEIVMNKILLAAVLVAVGAGPLVSTARASTVIPYPNKGIENSGTYTFTAINDGPVTAYFAGSAAGFSEVLGMTVNGIPTGITGLNDHSSHIGDSLVLGNVHAGDTIVFFDQVSPLNTGDIWYSDPALNGGDGQHVYSTFYDGLSDSILHVPAGVIPAGVYVGFEDLKKGPSNFDYLDDTFVVTNVSSTTDVTPLPATLPLFATGLGGLALLSWRRKRLKYPP